VEYNVAMMMNKQQLHGITQMNLSNAMWSKTASYKQIKAW
jgi:hypothetical protein